MASLTMDKLVALCKNRGFIFAGSEIYGGLANTWDYGPLGVEFKNNVKRAWWRKFVQESPYNTGVDCAILMNREVWVASGHVGGFNDPLMDCKACKARFRADKLIEDFCAAHGEEVQADGWSNEEMEAYIAEHGIPCPVCGKKDFTGIRQFNLMFKTFQGVTEDTRFRDLPAPGDRAGHLRQFQKRDAHHAQKAARGHLPDRQILPQRDHARQLHLPHPRIRADGAGILLPARAKIWSGSPIGEASAAIGCSPWA